MLGKEFISAFEMGPGCDLFESFAEAVNLGRSDIC